MEENKQYLDSLTEIRSIMERSSKFLSLSGLSGISAGITALICGIIAYFYLDQQWGFMQAIKLGGDYANTDIDEKIMFFVMLAGITLFVALMFAYLFTRRNAKRKSLKMWDSVAKRVTINMAIPLLTGGTFAIILVFQHHIYGLTAPITLIFYGLALLNVAKFTFDHTRYLAYGEIVLGLLSLIFFGYGLLFWIIGFGIFHIIYGLVLYNKYEK